MQRLTTLVMALTLLLGLSSVTTPRRAEAATPSANVTCDWTGHCEARLNQSETRTLATLGAAAAGSLGIPVSVAVAGELFAHWAVDHGYCLILGYNIYGINTGVTPGYYRC